MKDTWLEQSSEKRYKMLCLTWFHIVKNLIKNQYICIYVLEEENNITDLY